MVDSKQVYASWSKTYMSVLLEGFKALPDEVKAAFPKEEQAGILRGMMIEAGKSGLVPTAAEVVKMLEAAAAPAPKDEQRAPAGEKVVPQKQDAPQAPTTSAGKAPESVPGEYPYDKDRPGWNFCPVCHNRDIDQVSDKTGKHYQACGPCKVYLNVDGKAVRIGNGERVKPMGTLGESRRWGKVEA